MVIVTLSQNFTSGINYTLTMLIERNEGQKLLKRISRHEPHDPIAWINQNISPILTIQAFEMFTQFDMLKKRRYTSQTSTACFRPSLALRVGMNSCPTKPL